MTMKISMQNVVVIPVAEAELFWGTLCAKDIIFVMRVIEPLGFKVKNHMIM